MSTKNLIKSKVVKNVNVESSSQQEEQRVEDPLPVEDKEDFDEKISHSKLSERDEQYLGNKWKKRTNVRKNLFESRQGIKKSIIAKEVLDKPLALRK